MEEDQQALVKRADDNLEIRELLSKLRCLDTIFDVHRKIGEGTFSSVYLGSLRQHRGLPDSQKKWFAIKHLVPTAHPSRIEHELKCLKEIGGKDHVIGVELCMRQLDTIVFIMPYIPHKKFAEYVGDMSVEEVREYMRALLTALRHVHSFGVIHRDVKPSNFLYDRERRRYLLVDFGLAQRMVEEGPSPAHAHSAKRHLEQDDSVSVPEAKRIALDLSTRPRHTSENLPLARPLARPLAHSQHNTATKPAQKAWAGAGAGGGAGGGAAGCACAGRGGVCSACAALPAPRAPRAGTQGFRPPEVLLKCPRQGSAVDTWAGGVVLGSLLTSRYPLLRAAGDAAALAELASLLGSRAIRAAAVACKRRLVMSREHRGICLRKLAARLRGGGPAGTTETAGTNGTTGTAETTGPMVCAQCRPRRDFCLCPDNIPPSEIRPSCRWGGFPDSAFALCSALLEPQPQRRLTAHQALLHPFFQET